MDFFLKKASNPGGLQKIQFDFGLFFERYQENQPATKAEKTVRFKHQKIGETVMQLDSAHLAVLLFRALSGMVNFRDPFKGC